MKIKINALFVAFLFSCASPPKIPVASAKEALDGVSLEEYGGQAKRAPRRVFVDARFNKCERLAIRKAINRWNKKAGILLKDPGPLFSFAGYAVGRWSNAHPPDGKMTVYCLNTPEEWEEWKIFVDPNGGGVGVYTISGDILIPNMKYGEETKCQPDFDNFRLYLIVLHELGHALGIGHSDIFTAVMYKNFLTAFFLEEDGWPGLTEEDLRLFCLARGDCKN